MISSVFVLLLSEGKQATRKAVSNVAILSSVERSTELVKKVSDYRVRESVAKAFWKPDLLEAVADQKQFPKISSRFFPESGLLLVVDRESGELGSILRKAEVFDYILKSGQFIDPSRLTEDQLRAFGAVSKGAVHGKTPPAHLSLWFRVELTSRDGALFAGRRFPAMDLDGSADSIAKELTARRDVSGDKEQSQPNPSLRWKSSETLVWIHSPERNVASARLLGAFYEELCIEAGEKLQDAQLKVADQLVPANLRSLWEKSLSGDIDIDSLTSLERATLIDLLWRQDVEGVKRKEDFEQLLSQAKVIRLSNGIVSSFMSPALRDGATGKVLPLLVTAIGT